MFRPPVPRPLAALLLAAALAAAGAAHAQGTVPGDTPRAQDAAPPAGPSFELAIEAPPAERELLQRHLSLGRYREVPDLDEAELARLRQQAQDEARRLLGTLGLFNPDIDISIDNGVRPPRVVVRVKPGTPATVRDAAITFEGDIATAGDEPARAQRESIRQAWALGPGQRFTQEAWDSAKAEATRALQAKRYPRGRIENSVAEIDAQAGEARLGLRLDSGPRFYLGPLQVSGLSRYDPRLVPRISRLQEGAEYDQERLLQAQLRLAGSGYFDSAFIHVDPEGDPQAAPVQVNLREAPLQKVVLGLGASTDRGPRATMEYRHNRVPGIGWRADTRVQLERKAPFLETEWTGIPDADGWRWGVLARTERVLDDTQDTHAQRLRLGRLQTGERIDRQYSVQWDSANVRDTSGLPPQDTGDGTAVAFNYAWTRREFDSVLRPSRGYGLAFEAGGGVTFGGQNIPFQRGVLRWLQLLPLGPGRLQLRAEGGAVFAPEVARIPSTQLFRTGGDTSVRGYGYREIGVTRAGVVEPGRYLALGSVEWQWPIRRDGRATPWEQAVFVDSGSVADRPGDLHPWTGIGTGVRYASPIGPLRADLAWATRTRRLRLHVSVGFTF